MNHLEKQSWEQVRAKGHDHFILSELLRVGVPFGLFVTFGMFLVDLFSHHTTKSFWSLAVEFAVMALAFGYGMGESRWRSREGDYHKPTDDDSV